MTISYAAEVPNGSSFGCFWRILLKWRGSVYKLIWRELLAYLSLYYTINVIYRYGLNDDQKRSTLIGLPQICVDILFGAHQGGEMIDKIISAAVSIFKIFEKIRQYFGAQSESIPMSFVLGFYVSLVVKRWWEQYRMLPWPDTLALFISAGIPGNHETGRLMRRNIMRYAVLSYVITLQRISLRVKRRFPSWQHIVDAGLMLESEKKIFEIMDGKSPMSKYWMPLVWATNIINRARKDGLITSDHIVQTLLMELSDIRRRLGGLIGYDTVCVPLVYTQVVTLVLYTYFIAALMGRQMVPIVDQVGRSTKYEDPDLYFPLFTALQFCFYVGWLKVAEVLINPFGEDDDDFELNWLIDRHIKASYMIVDEMHEEHPELLKDQYWEEVVPRDLPYTVASEHYRRSEPKGSAEQYKVKQADAVYANIIPTKRLNEDVYADYESVDTPIIERRKNWFTRQITRMGSVRSSSTAYSSGGLFARNRHNSVYSSPEAGMLPNHIPTSTAHKMSFYDKFVNRKSVRAQRQLMKQNSKLSLNGGVMATAPPKNRPRIPTPDVTKESMDREHNRFAITLASSIGPITNTNGTVTPSIASGVALMTHQLANTPNMYHTSLNSNDLPVVGTLLLSPIKEMDSNSVNNTLQIGHPATAALANAVLPQNLKTAQFDFNGFTTNTSTSIPTITHSSAAPTNTVSVLSMVLPSTSPNYGSNIPTSIGQDMFPLSVSALNVPITTHSNVIITELPADITTSITTPTTIKTDSLSNNESEMGSINKSASLRNSSKRDRSSRKVNNHMKSASTSNETTPIERKSSLDLKPLDSLYPPANGKYKEVASAPSTLTKSKPETKTGEVYV